MGKNDGLLVVGGALIVYSLFRKANALGSLTFYPDRVQSIRFEGMSPVIIVGLGVQNTSNQSFTVRSLAGNLYCNDTYAGNVSSFNSTTILPNSQRIILITIRLQLIGVSQDIIRAFNYGNFRQEIILDLNANVDGLQVPIIQKMVVGG